jgi:NTP pyrophosphatase (non-canonical NTP hydrolase)
MSDIKNLTDLVLKFRDERDWKQFHNPKDSAIALLSEATEVLDEFKWLNEKEIEEYLKTKKSKVADELSDVLFWVLLMSHDLDIDIIKAFKEKRKEDRKKYPIKKSRGKHTKYTEL